MQRGDAPETEDQLGLRNTNSLTRQEVEAKRQQFLVGGWVGVALKCLDMPGRFAAVVSAGKQVSTASSVAMRTHAPMHAPTHPPSTPPTHPLCQELSRDPEIYEKLTASIAPSIWQVGSADAFKRQHYLLENCFLK